MKGKNKKFFTLNVLTLLLFSCSLVQPLSTTKALKSFQRKAKSTSLSRPALGNDPVHCVVTTGYEEGLVNLRAGAGVTFDVLLVLEETRRLEVLDLGDWFKVSTAEGVIGYINSKYCKIGE